jgi:hypothetical protein
MSPKRIISSLLLAFVAVSLIYLVIIETGTTSDGDGEGSGSIELTQQKESPLSDQIVAYYFHGLRRCKTCLKIEENSKLAIESAFADDINGGRLLWKAVNYEEQGNEHFAEEFQLVVSSLVIVDLHNGKPVEWKILDKVWDLVWKEDDFFRYVQEEVKLYLDEG